jgi:hypothetical protein
MVGGSIYFQHKKKQEKLAKEQQIAQDEQQQ